MENTEKKSFRKEVILHFLLMIVLVAGDQVIKYLARTKLLDAPVILWKKVFSLQLVYNTGGAFGALNKYPIFLLLFSVVILTLVTIGYFWLPKQKKLNPLRFCMMLVITGALGNMIDRIIFGKVTDIFSFDLINFPVFNLADICIVCGCILAFILLLFYYKDEDINQWKKSKSK